MTAETANGSATEMMHHLPNGVTHGDLHRNGGGGGAAGKKLKEIERRRRRRKQKKKSDSNNGKPANDDGDSDGGAEDAKENANLQQVIASSSLFGWIWGFFSTNFP